MATVGDSVTNSTGTDSSSTNYAGVGAGIAIGVAGTVILGIAAIVAVVLILKHGWEKEKKKASNNSAASEQSSEKRTQGTLEFTTTLYSGEDGLKTDTREEYDPLAPGARSQYIAKTAYNPGYDDKSILLMEGQEVEVLGTNQYGWWWVKTTNNQTGIVEEGRVPASYLELLSTKAETQPPALEAQPPATETQLPATETQPPALEAQPPATETQLPATETQLPATETRFPATETQLPVPETRLPAPETNNVIALSEPSETI